MKKSTALLLTLCLTLCGCKNSDNLSEPPSSVAEISDPFGEISNGDNSLSSTDNETSSSQGESEIDEDEEIQKNQQRLNEAASQIQQLATDVYIEKAEWVDDETLKLPLKLTGKGNPELKFCPLVFCDGKLAQTSLDGENFGYSECRINFIEISDDAPFDCVTHEIYVKPVFDSSLTSHYFALGYIANPDERPDDYWMVSGMLVQSHAIWSTKLNIDKETELDIDGRKSIYAEGGNILKADSAVPLTDELKAKYQLNEDSAYYIDLDNPANSQTLSQDGKHQYNIMLANGADKAKFSVVAATTRAQRLPYRVTFFVNHKPVKINGGYDYLGFTLEGGKISATEVEINGLKDKDIVYAVFCPMPEAPTYREWFEITNVYIVEEHI